MEKTFIVRHRGLSAMLPPKVKLNQGDGMESKFGFVSRGSGGPELLN